jgi:hypothetical protein
MGSPDDLDHDNPGFFSGLADTIAVLVLALHRHSQYSQSRLRLCYI